MLGSPGYGVLPKCDSINTGYNKLLTDIRRFFILEHRIAPVIGGSLLDWMSGVTSAVGLRVVAGIASNMAFTNSGMSSVVSGREGVVGCPLQRFPDDGLTVVSSSRSGWRFCPSVVRCCFDVAHVFTPFHVVEFLDFLPLIVSSISLLARATAHVLFL